MNPVRSIRNRIDARQRNLIVGRANAARDARQWREAAAAYREYLDLMPTDSDIWVQFGHMMKEAGSLNEAEAAYRKALSLRSDFSDTHLMLGHALKLQGRLSEALNAYRRAVELDPHDERSREEFDRLSAKLTAPRPQTQEIRKPEAAVAPAASNENESPPDALRLAGDKARDSRNWAAAANAYKQYLAIRNDDVSIWVQYGHVLKEGGYFGTADAAYTTAERLAPDIADTYLNHGHLLKAMGRKEDAVRAFRRAVALNPADAESAREADALSERPQTAPPPPAPIKPPPSASENTEAEILSLKERLAKSEEQLRLMQGQSRAIRVLSSELMKARQEAGELAPRIAALEAENADLRQGQSERFAALEARLHQMRGLEPNHPFLLVEQHFARRAGK